MLQRRVHHLFSAYDRGRGELQRFFAPPKVFRPAEISSSLPTALVVGNGPSLALTDPSQFSFDAMYLCNYAHRLDQRWRDNGRALVLNPHREYWLDEVVEAAASMGSGTTLFLNDRTDNSLPKSWNHLRLVRITATQRLLDPYGFPKAARDLSKIKSLSDFFRYRHTPMLSIQIALYEGYKQIILVGMDHDHVIRQLIDDVPRVAHAYDESRAEQEVMPKQTYLDLAKEINLTWGMYAAIANLANVYGARILDATPRGQLDVFPRLSD